MNYDKLSRALRYYYDKNIMTKVSFTSIFRHLLIPSAASSPYKREYEKHKYV
ncbi:hypothetical protein ANCDUO_25190 [Ancylostoma duodenale]|uniref:ETS domain-containing protein n=1 Tax=Ancylostoma duodenale TaxID=51022 RepID=A0A0C2C527_9BILA|nr:hypothetical protein ANCDUO_25190 [Ancylostoma duodenale]